MKKKILAILFGGVVAVNSFTLQAPVMVRAEETSETWEQWAAKYDCKGFTDAHIKSNNVAVTNGLLTLSMMLNTTAGNEEIGCEVYVCDQKLESAKMNGKDYYDFKKEPSYTVKKNFYSKDILGTNYSITYAFEGLTVGKTYYVYCKMYDSHGEGQYIYSDHYYGAYLGSGVPTATSASTSSSSGNTSSSSGGSGQTAWSSYESTVTNEIQRAASGSTIVMEKGISALSNSIMKELLEKGDVSLKLEFTYEDQEYVIIIPAGTALDNDIPWYGPLYLAQQFGNKAGAEVPETNVTISEESTPIPEIPVIYEVKRGDSLNKIAAANNMTLAELLEKNPEIKDPNKIGVGQKINL